MRNLLFTLAAIVVTITIPVVIVSCSDNDKPAQSDEPIQNHSRFPFDADYDVTNNIIYNEVAYITSQCYTKTSDAGGNVFNPCFTCHIKGTEPNFLDDGDLQLSYSFPGAALKNPWTNLFEDRSMRVAAISDEQILDYVRTNNYLAEDGTIILADLLNHLPKNWDLGKDGTWDGYIPDSYYSFDTEGFDRDPKGNYTGWRAFGYYPFLGTFWPTNGSTDDVMIRLGEPFRQNEQGDFDLKMYKLNLAIVEAVIKRSDVAIEAVDETVFQVDIDKDGAFGEASLIKYDWAPTKGRTMSFVGKARQLQEAGELHLSAGLYPVGTEFLHSVRYIDPQADGDIALGARMKELRYAKKHTRYKYFELEQEVMREASEKALDPDITKNVLGDMERGTFAQGWRYQGFIEDKNGHLRPQTKEETVFCMGCHSGIGATTDTIFSFSRKFDADKAFQGGWYHWTQKGLKGIPELKRQDGQYEYSHYLAQNGAGDEFRANEEVMAKFFDDQGKLKETMLEQLHEDISLLLFPSRERALTLNKAYRVIVQDQGFVNGRDATVTPIINVHHSLEQNEATGVTVIVRGP